MKNFYLLTITTVLILAMSCSNGSEKSGHKTYADYIEEAANLAKDDAKPEKVKYNITMAFKENKEKSCETFTFMLDSTQSWKIVKDYSGEIKKQLKENNCLTYTEYQKNEVTE
ncbi:hypothetical protein [Marinigracilibium pacificum]|uniref:Lipoprotein n=1 Tax=Marinigracilibium pacificum TaxID=2729599 RepID=A0A848J473_9BACT|nr:hypothetical protein [Marinigracilibium pacificum]NMM50531.1 hypothetical protein [Marinigracilibium pacificum]